MVLVSFSSGDPGLQISLLDTSLSRRDTDSHVDIRTDAQKYDRRSRPGRTVFVSPATIVNTVYRRKATGLSTVSERVSERAYWVHHKYCGEENESEF